MRWQVLSYFIVLGAVGIFLISTYINALNSNKVVANTTALTIVAIGFSAYFSLRSNYLYNSRQADMQVLDWAIKAQSSKVAEDDPARQMAKNWLKFSEDYRRASVTRGYSALTLIYSAASLLVSLFLAVAVSTPFWVAAYFFAVMLFVAAPAAHFVHLGYEKQSKILDSLGMNRFLILPPRWHNVQSVIDSNEWLKSYLEDLSKNPHLLGL